MTTAATLLSPKSQVGSIWWSMAVHAIAVGGVLLALQMHWLEPTPPPADFVDLGYETFDAPPAPTQEVKRVMKSPEPKVPVETKTNVDDAPKELQDEKSDVAGTQKTVQQSNPGADGSGDATSTPYYKIRPKYPKAALISGVEGWVMFEVDINEQGGVENVRAIDGEQRNMFEMEAKRALEQWKYRPFLDASGKPYRKLAHHVRVDFKLSDMDTAGG